MNRFSSDSESEILPTLLTLPNHQWEIGAQNTHRSYNYDSLSLPRGDFEQSQSFLVGDTPVFRQPELSDYFGIRHLTIKDESCNPLGTHKDRKSLGAVRAAINGDPAQRPEALCILTAGNAGLSLAHYARRYGLTVTAFVSEQGITPTLRKRLESDCEQVIELDLEGKKWSAEELCALSGGNQGRRVMDVTNHVIEPYEAIAYEIGSEDPKDWPDVLVLPVGGGELFLGVINGLRKMRLKTRVFGVTAGKKSVADKLYAAWRPYGDVINSLTNESSPHRLFYLNNELLLLKTFDRLRTVRDFVCEPSSAASFAALHQIKSELRPDDKVMVLNTGAFKPPH